MQFLTAYGPKVRVQVDNTAPEKGAKQSFKQDCDINNILKRFIKTGILDFTNRNEARYGDVTGLEFQAAQNTIAKARSMFEELPAKLRNRFDNDPAKLLDFVQDPKNREEGVQLGLFKKAEAPAPAPAPVAPAGATS